MRRSRVAERLRTGGVARLCSLGHVIPAFPTMAGDAGFDAIWLDLEHKAMNPRDVQALLAYHRLADVDCLVRPPTLEKTALARYLEDGATGLVIPHVSTPELAARLVEIAKFPPIGDRGLDSSGLEGGFRPQPAIEFAAAANRETLLIVMLETPTAIENVDAIACLPGVDALLLGPGDLGFRLRLLDETGDALADAVGKVAAAARRHGKPWGFPCETPAVVRQMTSLGARIVNYGADVGFLRRMLEVQGKELAEALGSP